MLHELVSEGLELANLRLEPLIASLELLDLLFLHHELVTSVLSRFLRGDVVPDTTQVARSDLAASVRSGF